jgi:ribosome-binding factor A
MLQSAARFIQRELKPKLTLRYVPALTFQQDRSLEEGARLLSIMDESPPMVQAPVESEE